MQNVHCDCPLASNEPMIVYASLLYFAWHVWASKGSQSQLAHGFTEQIQTNEYVWQS